MKTSKMKTKSTNNMRLNAESYLKKNVAYNINPFNYMSHKSVNPIFQ